MSFEVRPCADSAEAAQALLAIGQYFSLEAGSECLERFRQNLPLERMHAARDDGRIVGGRFEELTAGAAARADAMFGWARKPWRPGIF